MINKIIIAILLPIMVSSYGQDLRGKWLKMSNNHAFSVPKNTIFEITKNELIIYSFDKVYSKSKLKIDTINKIFKQGEKQFYREYEYSIRDTLTLTKYFKNERLVEGDIKTKIVTRDYVKLLPTKINYPIEKILKKEYNHFFSTYFQSKEERKIIFNKPLCSGQKIENIDKNKICSRYTLKKIDNTYLIIYYWKNNDSKWMVPIKEINEDHLLVYGVVGRPGFMKLHEIKEIESTNTIFHNN